MKARAQYKSADSAHSHRFPFLLFGHLGLQTSSTTLSAMNADESLSDAAKALLLLVGCNDSLIGNAPANMGEWLDLTFAIFRWY